MVERYRQFNESAVWKGFQRIAILHSQAIERKQKHTWLD